MARKHFTKLPDKQELQDILAAESQRNLLSEKINSHYPDFSSIKELFHYFGLSVDIFSKDYTLEDLANKKLVSEMHNLINIIVKKILNSESNKEIELFNKIYDYLSEEDEPQNVDIIFVFGSKADYRIKKAIKLYKQGFSKLIMISGGNPIYKQEKLSEAEKHKAFAVQEGIPENDILIENKSISIADNIKSSLNFLDREKIKFNNIILVNSPFSQRRGWVHFKKYLSDNIEIIRVNSEVSEDYSRNSWYRNEIAIRVIVNEFVKMKVAVILNTA